MLTAAERPAARAAWIALQQQLDDPGLMCSWEWTGTWLEHYGDVVAHRFVVGEDERGVRGIALVAEPRLRRLRPPTIVLGTAGEPHGSSVFVERNRLLVHPDDRAAFAAALLDELEADGRWQRMRFDGMVPSDADALLGERPDAKIRVDECPVANLAQGAGSDKDAHGDEDAFASLPSGTRRRVRQSLKRLGPLETEWAQTAPVAGAMLEQLIELHQAHWHEQGQSGAFASDRFSAFHRDLVRQLVPMRRAALFCVRQEARTIACLYGLIDGKRLLFYQSGLLRNDDNRVRVGLVAHALFMQACREHGLSEYDFLAPAARYKRELAGDSEQLVWAELERPGLRLRLQEAARRARRLGGGARPLG
ncbi:MAG TPA: GNAT family N-acetyltransferase [Solirubrobacteraceae bacterium]|nr:GNAT family N-acetyltransferase [Solirubrobacteraceae bacterium]